MIDRLATTTQATKGALTVRLTINADRATIELLGCASSIDFDDSEAVDELSPACDLVELAIRKGVTRLNVRLNARLDEGCSARFVGLLSHAHQRGLTVRLCADKESREDNENASRGSAHSRKLPWPRSLRSAEVIVHNVGLLLSVIIGWALYLWHKF